jgi:BASS family bile acid:Na+ symporter
MSDILAVIMQLSVLAFVITSMLAMGLSLTVGQIVEPLRNVRLVILALLANFVLVPILALLILQVIDLDEGLATGLILLATAAGAPFLPKLAQVAKGNMAFSVGLMVLLMVVTIIYMPIEPTAEALYPHMSQTSTVALVLLMISALVLNFSSLVGVIGTGAIIAILVFLLVAFVLGYFLGGSDRGIRSVLGLGTAQRNLAAAMVVAGQNFSDDPNVLVMILVAALLGLVLLMVIGGELGRRGEAAAVAG